MPTWNQIQSQLRNPNNPVVFFDISVGTTVSNACVRLGLHIPLLSIFVVVQPFLDLGRSFSFLISTQSVGSVGLL
jgi:hypothetical protein